MQQCPPGSIHPVHIRRVWHRRLWDVRPEDLDRARLGHRAGRQVETDDEPFTAVNGREQEDGHPPPTPRSDGATLVRLPLWVGDRRPKLRGPWSKAHSQSRRTQVLRRGTWELAKISLCSHTPLGGAMRSLL